MRLSLAGDLDAATELCEETRVIGERVGVRTTGVAYAVQNVFLAGAPYPARVARTARVAGRGAPPAGRLLGHGRVGPREMGEFDIARESLDRIARSGFTCIPRNGVWLANMRLLAGTVFEVGARPRRAALRDVVAVPRPLGGDVPRRRSVGLGRALTRSARVRGRRLRDARTCTSTPPTAYTTGSTSRSYRRAPTSLASRYCSRKATRSVPNGCDTRSTDRDGADDWTDLAVRLRALRPRPADRARARSRRAGRRASP